MLNLIRSKLSSFLTSLIRVLLGTSVPGGASGTSSTGSSLPGKKGYPVSIFVCSDPSAFNAATAAIKR